MLRGACLCGAVNFAVEDALRYAFYCHCSRCRTRSGSAFAAIGGIEASQVQISGSQHAVLMEDEDQDSYGVRCSACHTFLFAAVRGKQYIHVSLGVLKDAPSRRPDHHIFVGSKAPWYVICDALPQYDELPP